MSEIIFKIRDDFAAETPNTFSQNYSYLFTKMNTDNSFIHNSILAEHVNFSEGFDPFLMHQYELMKNGEEFSDEAKILYSGIGIAQAYKFMKTKKEMMKSIESKMVGSSSPQKKEKTPKINS